MLKGGDIPGISRDVLDRIVKQYMERLYYATAKEQGREPQGVLLNDPNKQFDKTKYLRPLTELPPNMVTSVMSGKNLPYLTEEQTKTVKVIFKVCFLISFKGLLHSTNTVAFQRHFLQYNGIV